MLQKCLIYFVKIFRTHPVSIGNQPNKGMDRISGTLPYSKDIDIWPNNTDFWNYWNSTEVRQNGRCFTTVPPPEIQDKRISRISIRFFTKGILCFFLDKSIIF